MRTDRGGGIGKDGRRRRRLTTAEDLCAGWYSGTIGVVVGHPFDTVKVRLQSTSSRSSMTDIFTQLSTGRGLLRSIYKGVVSNFHVRVLICTTCVRSRLTSSPRFLSVRTSRIRTFGERIDILWIRYGSESFDLSVGVIGGGGIRNKSVHSGPCRRIRRVFKLLRAVSGGAGTIATPGEQKRRVSSVSI